MLNKRETEFANHHHFQKKWCQSNKQSSSSLSHQSKDLSVSSQSLKEKADINNRLGSNFSMTQTNNLAQAPMTGGSLKTQD